MAKKKASKKAKPNFTILLATFFALVLVVVCVFFANSKNDNGPQYEKVDGNNIKVENSAQDDTPSVSEKENLTEEIPSREDTPKEPESEPDPKPEPTLPAVPASFYDSVKYRSPDAQTADIFKHGRNLMLLNRKYELPADFEWDLVYWSNGTYVDAMYLNCEERNSVKAVDRAAYQPLKDMFAAAKEAGYPLELVSAYRSIYLQDKLFTRSVNSYMSQGYSEQVAIEKANYSRTFSGTSEHNTGLGFDILQKGNFTLSTSFENTEHFRWLMENAENYGFILRYAKDKTDITGIMYEPWHFRYVGVEHAKKINELGLCLEEYIDYLEAL